MQTPVSGKIENLPAAKEDLAGALWDELLGQSQQTVNATPDVDQIIRNVFPVEKQPTAVPRKISQYDADTTRDPGVNDKTTGVQQTLALSQNPSGNKRSVSQPAEKPIPQKIVDPTVASKGIKDAPAENQILPQRPESSSQTGEHQLNLPGMKLAEARVARPAVDGGALLRPYGGPGGGHHVPAQAAFKGDPRYDWRSAPAIPNFELDRLGVDHDLASIEQQLLYRNFAKTGGTLTWNDIERIEVQALIRGKMTRDMAEATVRNAINMLKKSGVKGPTQTPWKTKKTK